MFDELSANYTFCLVTVIDSLLLYALWVLETFICVLRLRYWLFCRDSGTERGSVASTGSSKHSSVRGSKHDSVRASGNPRDGHHFSIEMPQPVEPSTAVTSDRVSVPLCVCMHACMCP